MKKSLSLVLALVLLVAAFAGCAGIDEKKEEARGGIFRDYVTVSPAILNTHINTDATTVNRALNFPRSFL